jgi:hypothetical protein
MSKYLPGYPLKADIAQYSRHVSKVPEAVIQPYQILRGNPTRIVRYRVTSAFDKIGVVRVS